MISIPVLFCFNYTSMFNNPRISKVEKHRSRKHRTLIDACHVFTLPVVVIKSATGNRIKSTCLTVGNSLVTEYRDCYVFCRKLPYRICTCHGISVVGNKTHNRLFVTWFYIRGHTNDISSTDKYERHRKPLIAIGSNQDTSTFYFK